MCNTLWRGTCHKMIVKGFEDKLLEYAKNYYNKAYICSCVVQRRTIEFILYSDVEVLDFFSYKFIPYTIVKDGSLTADSFNVKAFSIYLNCAPLDLDCKFTFEDVDIVKNEKDNRKSIQCRKLELKRFNIFIMKKSKNIIVFDKESNSFLITGTSLISQLEDIRVLIRDILNIGLINEGFVEVHASAVANSQGKVNIICGNSNSGKTTILFDYLKQKYNLVSNGRVYLKPIKENLLVLGTPESIYIRPISFRNFPEILSVLPECEIEVGKLYDENCQPRDKIKSHYKEVCKVFGCEAVQEGTLNEIVFPLLSSPDNKVNSNNIIHNNIINYDDICRREWSGAININRDLYKINMENLKKRLVEYSRKIFVFREKDNYLYYRKD